MEQSYLLAITMGLILAVAKLGEGLFLKLGFPGFLGAVIAGLLLGPAAFGFVSEWSLRELSLMLGIGINFTLFLSGVEEFTNPALLRPGKREAIYSVTFLIVTMILVLFALYLTSSIKELASSIAFAAALSAISLGPLMKIVLEAEQGVDEIILSALRVGLLVELEAIILFNSIYRGFGVSSLITTIVFVAVIYLFGRKYLDLALRTVERYLSVKEAPFAIIVSMVLVTSYLAEILGFNAAVTALMLGMFSSQYLAKRPAYLERIRAFTHGFLEPLFFAGIGLYASSISLHNLQLSLLLLLTILPMRIIVGKQLGLKGRKALVLGAKGGVDAAMMLALLDSGMLDTTTYTSGIIVLLTSTVLASLAVRVPKPPLELWRLRLRDIELENNVVYFKEKASYAARLVSTHGAVVVVDEEYRPVGYIVAEDLVEMDPSLLERINSMIISRPEIPVVSYDALVSEVLEEQLMREPIIAVVDNEGMLVGTLSPKKLLQLTLNPQKRGKNRHSLELVQKKAIKLGLQSGR